MTAFEEVYILRNASLERFYREYQRSSANQYTKSWLETVFSCRAVLGQAMLLTHRRPYYNGFLTMITVCLAIFERQRNNLKSILLIRLGLGLGVLSRRWGVRRLICTIARNDAGLIHAKFAQKEKVFSTTLLSAFGSYAD